MKFASSAAASALMLTPILFARLLIQLSTAAPLGRVLWITLPYSPAALSRGLPASNASSTSTISVDESGIWGTYSANSLSKPARDAALPLPLFLLFFVLPLFPVVSFSVGARLIAPTASTPSPGSGGAVAALSPRRFFGRPSTTTRRCSDRNGMVLQVAVMVIRSTSPPL